MIRGVDIEPDYAFYTQSYRGRASEEDFLEALPDALADVEARIYEPASDVLAEHVDAAKSAVCAVADLIADPSKRAVSYTAGKVSQTLAAPYSLTAEAAIKRWLGRWGVLKHGRWV